MFFLGLGLQVVIMLYLQVVIFFMGCSFAIVNSYIYLILFNYIYIFFLISYSHNSCFIISMSYHLRLFFTSHFHWMFYAFFVSFHCK